MQRYIKKNEINQKKRIVLKKRGKMLLLYQPYFIPLPRLPKGNNSLTEKAKEDYYQS